MYIRFTVPSDAWRTERRVPSGLLQATYRLARSGRFDSRMWRLVCLVEHEGIPVRVYRTRRPGIVVYSDNLQVAAVPWRDTFDRRH